VRFDDYRFANHKDDIIEPVGKVVRVSVEIRVRLDRQELAALDAWNARLKPMFTGPQAIRFALRNQLLQLGLLSAQTNDDPH
jgi:hypothetical protein